MTKDTTNSETGGPAFPIVGEHGMKLENCEGMTLRNYFAAKIAAGDAAAGDSGWDNGVSDETIMRRATLYYRIADAMLKAGKS